MNFLKKTVLLFALIGIGVVDVFIYRSYDFYNRSLRDEAPVQKVRLLEKSGDYFAWNDLTFYELGKAYLSLGLGHLSEAAESESDLRKSAQNLEKSIMINPASPFSHFYLAQSRLHLELVGSETVTPYFEEFRKAAELAGEDSQIFNEVGRIFLSRWPHLSDQDRTFTLQVLKKILGKKDNRNISLILNTWELNTKDYEIIEQCLPEDARVYRQYARFLGEKSLSLESRHRYLARAESLDFEKAKDELLSGELKLSDYRIQWALDRFQEALDLLNEIRFYQALTGEESIDLGEFLKLKKSLFLNSGKCRIETGQSQKDYFADLKQYLMMEVDEAKIDALAKYLEDREIVSLQIDASITDLDRLAFGLLLLYKQAKYRDIINFARELERSLVIVSEEKGNNYLRILQIIGDSLQEIGHFYNAEDYYQKAYQIDPENLKTLLRLRQNYIRLNEGEKLLAVDAEIEKITAPKTIDFSGFQLRKGQAFRKALVLDGRKIALSIQFESPVEREDPLVSIFFNDRVVWDGYSEDGIVSVALEAVSGNNILQIVPVNCDISLVGLDYRNP